MNNRKSLLIILAVLLIGLAGWWHWRQSTPALATAGQPLAQNPKAKPPAAALPPIPPLSGPPLIEQVQTLLGRDLTPEEQQQLQDNPDQARTALAYLNYIQTPNHNSINVYGKVVDQYGAPVAGVAVRGATLLAAPGGSGGQEFDTQTDDHGLFSFTRLQGARFGVLFAKPGYEANARTYAEWWNTYKPDPIHPMVFTMYKLQGAEPMVHAKFENWIPYDGTSVSINLFNGKKSDMGELKITLMRSPVKIVRGRDHFDWTVKIEITGGMVSENDLYPYLAAEDGYQPTFDFSIKKDDPQWTQKLVRDFYIHTGNGNYGRIHVNLTTDSDREEGTGLSIEAWINPSGSRNLEFDPKKQIKP